MDILNDKALQINVAQPANEVLKVYLRVLLAHTRLTDRQLDVTAALVSRYAVYVQDGVKEPYASSLLFSTETRKAVVKELKISAPHLNNTFKSLSDKGVLSRLPDESYIIDPNLIPCRSLTFNFQIIDNAGSGDTTEEEREEPPKNDTRDSQEVEPAGEEGGGDSSISTEIGSYNNPVETAQEYIPEEDWVAKPSRRQQAEEGYADIEPVRPIKD
jgi:hypothetical protein